MTTLVPLCPPPTPEEERLCEAMLAAKRRALETGDPADQAAVRAARDALFRTGFGAPPPRLPPNVIAFRRRTRR